MSPGRVDALSCGAARPRPPGVVAAEGLSICRKAESRCRIADVTNSNLCIVETRKLFMKHLSNKSHALFHVNPISIRERNTCALLPTMLERKETKIRHLGDVLLRGVYTIDAALFFPLWHFFVHCAYASPVSLWSISL